MQRHVVARLHIFAVFSLAACVTSPNTRYPDSWPQRAGPGSSCEYLGGEYANHATQHHKLSGNLAERHQQLIYAFSSGAWENRLSSFDSVLVEVNGDAVTAYGRLQGTLADRPVSDLVQWKCVNGRLIRDSSDLLEDEFEIADSRAIELSATVDGSLVVNVSERESGSVLLIPYSKSQRFWNRHERITDQWPR